MITDADVTKLKKEFKKDFVTKDDLKKTLKNELKRHATKTDLFEAVSDLRVEMIERFEKADDRMDTMAAGIARIENSIDKLAGAIHDQQVENGAGSVHLSRHDRQIAALARATHVTLPD